ncbi:hemocyanin AA6 chain-like [Antedon mediterranea]|uniref:hemocyanin AA6 chain-like n=1 Tax=Antedon mediterranea TaxID=105859 RepID=UPI003AF8949C
MDPKKQLEVLMLFGYGQEKDASLAYHFPAYFVTVPATTIYPANTGILKKGEFFSNFKKKHTDEAARVYNYLISCDKFEDFVKAASYFKGILNEGLYLYALSVALAHRKDEHSFDIPFLWQLHPHAYFSNSRIRAALARLQLVKPTVAESDIVSTFVTGTHRDPEFKISWWREDVGLNWHHAHWHQVYPWAGIEINGKLTTKDREGELFYHMHQQMLARYDAERLAVGLLRVIPFDNWNIPIQEGYDSHLTNEYGTLQYAPRPSGMVLSDNYTDPTSPVTVHQQSYNWNRLLNAINTGKFQKKDNSYEDVNIDNLGAAIESSVSSPNPDLYGSLHNYGHDLLSIITDPDGRYKQAMGVMGATETAVRDPVFFRWHKYIDNLFVMHKNMLDPYSADDLGFKNIKLEEISVKVNDCDQNVLTTRMEYVNVDIYQSMYQGNPQQSLQVSVYRVNHDEFEYNMKVKNANSKNVKAAFRVFMAPSFDEHSDRFGLNEQRRLFIEMDKFVEEIPGNATHEIKRSSKLSSVVKPPGLSIKDILKEVETKRKSTEKNVESECVCRRERYCECGLPQNILLPRGTESGMRFDLFVMVTDWGSDNCTDNLDQGTSYCGVKNQKYPDGRAMGFPFDRNIDVKFFTKFLDTFVDRFDNMLSVPITIKTMPTTK